MTFKERYKARYEKMKNSPEFKRNSYTRRMTGILIFPLMLTFGLLAYLTEKLFGIPGYITCSIAGVCATTSAVLLSEKMADKKFSPRYPRVGGDL